MSRKRDLNPWPFHYEWNALPTELLRQQLFLQTCYQLQISQIFWKLLHLTSKKCFFLIFFCNFAEVYLNIDFTSYQKIKFKSTTNILTLNLNFLCLHSSSVWHFLSWPILPTAHISAKCAVLTRKIPYLQPHVTTA